MKKRKRTWLLAMLSSNVPESHELDAESFHISRARREASVTAEHERALRLQIGSQIAIGPVEMRRP